MRSNPNNHKAFEDHLTCFLDHDLNEAYSSVHTHENQQYRTWTIEQIPSKLAQKWTLTCKRHARVLYEIHDFAEDVRYLVKTTDDLWRVIDLFPSDSLLTVHDFATMDAAWDYLTCQMLTDAGLCEKLD